MSQPSPPPSSRRSRRAPGSRPLQPEPENRHPESPGKAPQLTLAFDTAAPQTRDQVRQIEQNRRYMEGRVLDIDREIETEPAAIQDLYRVVLTRREPVGMVYLWPETRG